MQIIFNEQPAHYPPSLTLGELLRLSGQRVEGTALAVNQQIIPSEQWNAFILHEGDNVLLFQAIAGG